MAWNTLKIVFWILFLLGMFGSASYLIGRINSRKKILLYRTTEYTGSSIKNEFFSQTKWRAGSALILKGKVYTLSCFISGPEDEWAYQEKLNMLALLKEGQDWIQKQALKNHCSVDFSEGGNFGMKEDIKLPYIERGTASGNESVDWVSKVLYKVGYKSTLELVNWVKHNTSCENLQVIIFVKGQGNGYAMAYGDEMDKERYFVEGAVLYEKYNGGEKLAASSIAHEILHLYGAWDLYKTFSQSEENEKRAKKLFPNSIMLRTSYNINELIVDELTAWLIGWNTKPEEWYESFRERNK